MDATETFAPEPDYSRPQSGYTLLIIRPGRPYGRRAVTDEELEQAVGRLEASWYVDQVHVIPPKGRRVQSLMRPRRRDEDRTSPLGPQPFERFTGPYLEEVCVDLGGGEAVAIDTSAMVEMMLGMAQPDTEVWGREL